jgi:ubiquinone/menaquinone biosynthesis C-methylase UbiE
MHHSHNRRIFGDAASYYQNLRWFKNRLTRYEYSLTRRVLMEELSTVPTGAWALEVGCGPGTWTREVAPMVERLTALDISQEMIEQARPYVGSENVEFVHTDVAEFPLQEQYDAVFSVRVVEYLADWKPVLARLVDAVAPGGRAVIITKTPISTWRGTGRNLAVGRVAKRLLRRLAGRPQPTEDPFWQRYLPPTELARLFEDQGLEDVRIRPVIYGLPIFMRGTKQYPLIPKALEPFILILFALGWHVADRLPGPLRPAGLVFSESYAVSGTRPSVSP